MNEARWSWCWVGSFIIPVSHPELIAHAEGARVAVVMLSESQIESIDLLLAPRMVFEEHPAARE